MGRKHKDPGRAAAALLLSMCLCLSALGGCGAKKSTKAPELRSCSIEHEPEFGGVYIHCTIDDFNAQGFAFGDSVNVAFSNGYVLEDLPYYNGYYTVIGSPLLVAYPGYPFVKACINNGDDLWTLAGLTEDDRATITLAEQGKYRDIQEARDIHFTDERSDYGSDAVFANFRAVQAGDIREGVLYRSASPCDDQHNRATYADALIRGSGVNFILDLCDNDEKIENFLADPDFASPCFLSLYESGSVAPIALNANYGARDFREKLAGGLTAMAEAEGPYLVHCTEGKDRTGFVCLLLEALCGASYEEIVRDYMITYDNYYGINEQTDKAKYDIIVESVLDPMLQILAGDETADVRTADLSESAEAYLRSGGMEQNRIDMLKSRLTAPAAKNGIGGKAA